MVSILLILVTAFYVLPLTDGLMADTETTCKYADKKTDDSKETKKDNGKEFIPGSFISAGLKNCKKANPILPLLSLFPVHFTVETPPPDRA